MRLSYLIILILFTTLFSSTWGITTPLGPAQESAVRLMFFEEGSLAQRKVDNYVNHLQKKRSQIYDNVFNYQLKHHHKKPGQAHQKARQNKAVRNYEFLINWVDDFSQTDSLLQQYVIGGQLLDIEDALKSEIKPVILLVI